MTKDITKSSLLEQAIKYSVIVCPICKGGLSLEKARWHKRFVQRGILRCRSCGIQFKIYARIPVLLPPGQYADWTHPFVEALFGNIRMSYDDIVKKYGIEKVRELYFKLIEGKYEPPRLYFKEPVDRRLLAEGSRRITKRAIEEHLKRIKEQTKGKRDFRKMIEVTIEILPKKILDMCSGGGFFLARLLERYRDFNQFFSFDIDYHCAKRVEGTLKHYKLLNKALPMVADARTMPFRSDYFDIVTNNYGFSQILGYSRALRESFRVLRPGGKLIVRDKLQITKLSDFELRSTIGFTVDELVQIHRYCDIYIDKEEFLDLAAKIGFSIDKVEDFGKSFVAVLSKY